MNTTEFLGGKYQGAEQILPGVIQTYRASETLTGRSVFVHRVSSTDDLTQQLVLYRLLSAALVRSPAVRSMVLDMRDEKSDWFVVTDTSPQCLLLREWLQFELDNASKPQESEKSLNGLPLTAANSPNLVTQDVPPTASDEPGEFTRFFRGGVPPVAPKGSGSDAPERRQTDRPLRTGVQRPNTPMPFVPPGTPNAGDPGEFTKLFNKSGSTSANPGSEGRGLEPSSAARDLDDIFGPRSGSKMPPTPVPPAPGEYTRIFGKASVPPPIRSQTGLGERARTDFDDPLAGTAPLPPSPPSAPPSGAPMSAGPSEYTRVVSGGMPTAGPGSPAGAGQPQVPSASGGGINMALPSVSPVMMPHVATPVMPHVPGMTTPVIPQPSMLVPPVSTAAPTAVAAVPAANAPAMNTKLIVFLAVLGVLAVLLILLVVLALRK